MKNSASRNKGRGMLKTNKVTLKGEKREMFDFLMERVTQLSYSRIIVNGMSFGSHLSEQVPSSTNCSLFPL
jgi:hypothetical protein